MRTITLDTLYQTADQNIALTERRQDNLARIALFLWTLSIMAWAAIEQKTSILISTNVQIDGSILLYFITVSSPIGLLAGCHYLALASHKYGWLEQIAKLCRESHVTDIHHEVYVQLDKKRPVHSYLWGFRNLMCFPGLSWFSCSIGLYYAIEGAFGILLPFVMLVINLLLSLIILDIWKSTRPEPLSELR